MGCLPPSGTALVGRGLGQLMDASQGVVMQVVWGIEACAWMGWMGLHIGCVEVRLIGGILV